MSEVRIICDENGLTFYSNKDGNGFKPVHNIAPSTLEQMSLADLEYSISFNCVADLLELQALFQDYFWSNDGTTPPLLNKDESRLPKS
ncbi:hypothetical protein LPB140_00275 [Sphingorhabdus lutea]|uniref:Uncharacterized protein n=1 Tax=Sphingorhabdus lutea TaxID=1913578 RepID=A0A1L3J8T8_9SPHN|nr:hypothetical protein [Sphingorhabdus lutea]APG61537.1 hypothetical protein LPB140_00275 [Sphingorhabdus lutea]